MPKLLRVFWSWSWPCCCRVVMLHADADADRVRELVRLPAGPSGRDAPLESGLSARRAQTQQVNPLLELWVDAPPCQARARAREPLLARGSRARRAWQGWRRSPGAQRDVGITRLSPPSARPPAAAATRQVRRAVRKLCDRRGETPGAALGVSPRRSQGRRRGAVSNFFSPPGLQE